MGAPSDAGIGVRRAPPLCVSLVVVSLLTSLVPARVEAVDPAGILVAYSFEEEGLATGPDTFAVFDHARGRVELSSELALSGWASIRIEDAPGDRDFPELQGYFPRRDSGRLHLHFALLVAEPDQELNIALAGPGGFALGRDGISFWLRFVDGELRHVTDSIPKRLLMPLPFVWYGVDVTMDLDRGSYDLVIREEGHPEPVVEIRGTPNAASAAGTAIDKLSFIGDLPSLDRSRTVYFVDDVLVGVDETVHRVPFVAPGRRRLFFDRCWRAAPPEAPRGPCPAAASPGDARAFLFERLLAEGRAQEALELADSVLEEPGTDPGPLVAWLERAAAAAHFLGLDAQAEDLLEAARARAPASPSVLVALSDLAHLRSDVAAERELREAVYGSLGSHR